MNRALKQQREEAAADARGFAARIAGSNIHPRSLLATDYLNHFNEVAMILDMVGDMPDMLEEAVGWRPRSYVEHFARSNLKDGALAIEAFDHVPADLRRRFGRIVAELDREILAGIECLATLLENPAAFSAASSDLSRRVQALLAALNGVIHAAPEAAREPDGPVDQADIDVLFGD